MARVRADFSEAAEKGDFSPRHVKEGEYLAKITAAEVSESKAGNKQIIFTFVSPQIRGATYPYYVPLDGKGAWKLRALLEAVGMSTGGKKAVNFDTDRLIGKECGIELLDDEYEGRMKSKIQTTFSKSEIVDEDASDGDVADEDDDYDEEPEEKQPTRKRTPAKKTAAARRKPAPVEEDDEDDDLDLDEL